MEYLYIIGVVVLVLLCVVNTFAAVVIAAMGISELPDRRGYRVLTLGVVSLIPPVGLVVALIVNHVLSRLEGTM